MNRFTYVHADFVRAFTPGTVFENSKGKRTQLEQIEVGQLVLPTGRIVACDPTYLYVGSLDQNRPFAQTVPPGKYPVILCLTRIWNNNPDRRVACAMVRFSDNTPVEWEMALLPGQELSTLLPDRFFGFGVDSGRGCFVDALAVETLKPEQELYSSRFSGKHPSNPDRDYWKSLLTPTFRRLDESWDSFSGKTVIDPVTGANLVSFSSGMGDGAYPSFWGLDSKGEPCCLVTDFELLQESFYTTLTFPVPETEATFKHPDLSLRGLLAIHVTRRADLGISPDVMKVLTEGFKGNSEFFKQLQELGQDKLDSLPPDRTVQVHLKGQNCLTGSPRIRVGERTYGPRRCTGSGQDDKYLICSEEPFPADAELVIQYRVRTVPL